MQIVLAALLLALLPASLQRPPGQAGGELSVPLLRALEEAGGELVGVTIVLADPLPPQELAAAAATADRSRRRELVIGLLTTHASASQAGVLAQLDSLRAGGHARRIVPLWVADVVRAEVDETAARALAARPDVARIHYAAPRGAEVLSGARVAVPAPAPAPAGGNLQCGVDLIGADEVWAQHGIDGRGVVVGVIDTGLCLSHPDISGQVWRNPLEIAGNGIDDDANGYVDDVNGWNFEGDSNDVSDQHGHGSHVAGIVAGNGAGGERCGVAPGCEVMVLKFFNDLAGEASVWEAMQYGLDNGADILSGSLGWHHSWGPDRATWRVICDNVTAAGVVVVFAAQNFGCSSPPDDVSTPADVPTVIAVGATDCSDVKAGFSSCGPSTWQNVPPYNDFPYPPGLLRPSISAPGEAVLSHADCAGYVTMSGTSMATPHVAGALALVLEADPTLDQHSAAAILAATAADLGPPGPDNETGAGRVDALAAVTAALANGNFCAGKLNSCGSLPSISSSGQSSASATSGFVVVGSDAHAGEVGILAYTHAGAAYPPLPFFGGGLCLRFPLRRGPIVPTGGTPGACDGSLSLDLNAFASGNAGGVPAPFLLLPGTTVHCQWWGRDSGDPFGVYLTDRLGFVVGP
ncbi:MAG: S8 family serine peptidase [Planctomycetota bacterium]|jgi:subtilisin family serine protease|nr:S8 family serine peptidase [Planctomycetota bacterium]MDP6989575.1 S8 family serine peptidase [Planctomycetota bacterium]